jgi:nicotinamide mononucleotide transporter
MGLQGYYLVISCYGWYHWTHGKRGEQDEGLPVSRASVKVLAGSLIIFIILFASMAQLLDRLTDSNVPWGDAFTTAGSIIATWMLARKIIEHWLFWIVIDTVAATLYVYKAMYPTTVLYLIYTGIAVIGYFQWKKTLIHE